MHTFFVITEEIRIVLAFQNLNDKFVSEILDSFLLRILFHLWVWV